MTEIASEPPPLAGGQHGARLVNQTVRYLEPQRGTKARMRQHECIRMRLTYERQVVMGQYITAQGHRERHSVRERILTVHWDAVICENAIRAVRRRVAQRLRPGRRRGLKTFAIVAVAEALHEHKAPVNHYTASALLGVFGMTCSRVWFNRNLRAAGWLPVGSISLGFDLEYRGSSTEAVRHSDGTIDLIPKVSDALSGGARVKPKAPQFGITHWMPNPHPWGH